MGDSLLSDGKQIVLEKRVYELGQRWPFPRKKNKVGVICVREIKNTILKIYIKIKKPLFYGAKRKGN